MTITAITKETRFDSYIDVVIGKMRPRQREVLAYLIKRGPRTAREISFALFGTTDRSLVHPRLNELVGMGLVAVTGKKMDSITGKMCAVYGATEAAHEAQARA